MHKRGRFFDELIAVTNFGCTIPNIESKIKDDVY
ncbi:UNVERIFIED_CONTAM: hypothetical protein Cloal_0554 [Acetivibrio alkalicellulosi]